MRAVREFTEGVYVLLRGGKRKYVFTEVPVGTVTNLIYRCNIYIILCIIYTYMSAYIHT